MSDDANDIYPTAYYVYSTPSGQRATNFPQYQEIGNVGMSAHNELMARLPETTPEPSDGFDPQDWSDTVEELAELCDVDEDAADRQERCQQLSVRLYRAIAANITRRAECQRYATKAHDLRDVHGELTDIADASEQLRVAIRNASPATIKCLESMSNVPHGSEQDLAFLRELGEIFPIVKQYMGEGPGGDFFKLDTDFTDGVSGRGPEWEITRNETWVLQAPHKAMQRLQRRELPALTALSRATKGDLPEKDSIKGQRPKRDADPDLVTNLARVFRDTLAESVHQKAGLYVDIDIEGVGDPGIDAPWDALNEPQRETVRTRWSELVRARCEKFINGAMLLVDDISVGGVDLAVSQRNVSRDRPNWNDEFWHFPDDSD